MPGPSSRVRQRENSSAARSSAAKPIGTCGRIEYEFVDSEEMGNRGKASQRPLIEIVESAGTKRVGSSSVVWTSVQGSIESDPIDSCVSLAVLSGATNAGVTAYNNSQQGSNDSVGASAVFGTLGGGVGVAIGNFAGATSSRVLTTSISNPAHNPALGVLLTGPSFVRVPNQEAAAMLNMYGGATGQAGVAAVAPPISSNSGK